MTNSATVRDSGGVCPSCSTRLRISLETADKSQFECPECGVALVADQQSDGTIQVTKFSAVLSEASSHGVDLPRSARQLPGGSRTIAAAVTLIVGILLLIFLLPGSTESQQAGADPDSTAGERHDDNVDSSDADPSDLVAASGTTASAVRPRDHVLDEPRSDDANIGNASIGGASDDSLPNDKRDVQEHRLLEVIDPSHADVIAGRLPAPDGKAVSVASGTETAAGQNAKITNSVGKQATDPDAADNTEPDSAAQPAAKPMSVRERLAISIRSFRQTEPTPLRDVIRIVERMCRVRVDISAASPEQLDKEITISLQQTTPTGILAEAGRKCGLRVIVEDASVRMLSDPE